MKDRESFCIKVQSPLIALNDIMTNNKYIYNNKKVAKNTLALYTRMIFIVCIGLYTSRVVLDALGASDYGVYNVVGGICIMLSFINTGMVMSSQRFISYELGIGDEKQTNKIFCTSMNIHIVIAILIFLLSESIGLWYLNTQMNIPEGRMNAANWVYQFSIFSFIVSICSVPYNSSIVAHEDLKIYAYIGIYESVMKLILAYCLMFVSYDKLIIYASLIFITQVSIRCFCTWFCKKHYRECFYRFVFDKELSKKMFSFAGWSVLGNLGFSTRDQGSNIIMNLFYGTTINAARGIAGQLNSIINGFANNFIVALNPQITKLYASNEIEKCKELTYSGARFSFYLLSVIIIPFLLNIDYILNLWLKEVPLYTNIFLCVILLSSLLYAISQPLTTALQATGNIKWFQIIICLLLISEMPVSYIVLYWGLPPYWALFPMLISNFIAIFIRIILLSKMNSHFKIREYTRTVLFRCLLIFSGCCFMSYHVHSLFPLSFIGFATNTILIVILTCSTILIGGTTEKERKFIVEAIKKKLCRQR